jgi:trimeric autotransporter adhesin
LNGNQEDATAEDSGSAYIYTRTGTTWAPAAYVKPSTARPAAEFGISLSLNGDGKMLAVGAFKDSGGGAGVNPAKTAKASTESGAAYVYY